MRKKTIDHTNVCKNEFEAFGNDIIYIIITNILLVR